ncbi:hypothetical protein ACO0LD_28230 [Undibacterium sp. Ji83W]|uniref:hypothetical protein n=1 Tax=Undibacterium sp. Ji83W TaxID=3413043 RepID=UPI003BF204FC
MSPNFDKDAALELQQLDLIHHNEDAYKKFKPFYLGLLFLFLSLAVGASFHFMSLRISVHQLIISIVAALVILLIFISMYAKTLWRIRRKTMRREDFLHLRKWNAYEAEHQDKITHITIAILAVLCLFFSVGFLLVLVAQVLLLLGLFFVLFAVVTKFLN